MRSLIRPTGFVDSPFGHDGKVARLAGGLGWFGLVELIRVVGHARVSSEILPVEGIEARFDESMAADWARIDGVLPLDESAMTVMADKRSAPRVAFGLLVESAMVPAGSVLTDAKRRWMA